MRRFAIAVCLFTPAGSAQAQVDKKAEKELTAGYHETVNMMMKKDVTGVLKMMTPDATMTERGKYMTRAHFEPMLKQQFSAMQHHRGRWPLGCCDTGEPFPVSLHQTVSLANSKDPVGRQI